MKYINHTLVLLFAMFIGWTLLSAFANAEKHALTIHVDNLKNNKGLLQFTLYNKEGSIPDENFEKHYLQKTSSINNNKAKVTFENLTEGHYAVNILHDENKDGKIEKGFVLPVEGIGFSNLTTINPLNRPSYKKTKFALTKDTSIKVSIIYM